SVCMVHAVHRFDHQRKTVSSLRQAPRRYILISHENQQQIEWILRSLLFYSWLKGKEVMITVWDEGSSDDTLKIVERFVGRGIVSMRKAAVSLHAGNDPGEVDDAVIVRLNHTEDLRKIPLLL